MLHRPAQLDHRDFPNWDAYVAARQREFTRARILNMRVANRELAVVAIARQAGVGTAQVKAVLGLPNDFPISDSPGSWPDRAT
jgi:hypothetical protein